MHPTVPRDVIQFRFVELDVELVDYLDCHHDQALMGTMHDPAHPGEVLRDYLPDDWSIGEVAKRLGVTRLTPSAVLNGRAGVSAAMALRLGGALGTRA